MANHRKCCCSIGDRNLSGVGWITGPTSGAREVEEVEEDIFIFQYNRQLFHVNGPKGNFRFSGAAGGPICCAEMESYEMQ
jgi:hypothetical protein